MDKQQAREKVSGYAVERQPEERMILFAAVTDGAAQDKTEASLDELTELLKTAGASVVGRLVQSREKIAGDLYLGRGKVEELRRLAEAENATGVVCDDELSPAQLMNLQDALKLKVLDRTMVILDIFAAHAGSYEGKLQVELAQLRFRATRLVGMRDSLSRLGGGIGTRGPGEKKLEIDRRVIRERISHLKAELQQVESRRNEQRKQRTRAGIPVVSIVGYTNAGKSTLLNTLTDAGVLEEDMLFATLDPTTRSLTLPSGQQVLCTDTVGFIKKLPHHLIEAFKSTLEEAKYSDMILHVVDASDPDMESHIETVYETLRNLNIEGQKNRPIITVFNKLDRLAEDADCSAIKDLRANETVYISAKTGMGIDRLLDVLEKILREQKTYIRQTFSYQEAGKLGLIRKYGEILTEEYLDDGIFVEAYVPKSLSGHL